MKLPVFFTRPLSAGILFLLFALCTSFHKSSNAVHVQWNTYVIKTGANEADLHVDADIPGGWRMYSQKMQGTEGPLPTNIEIDPNPAFSLVGSPRETGKYISFFEDDLGIKVTCLVGKASYVQHIRYTGNQPFSIKFVVNYMLTREGDILPPDDDDFSIDVQP